MNDDCDKCVHAEKISDTDYMIDYTWQAISITNSIASISFSNRSDKLEVCSRLCRKAAQAFAEAERVRQEILKRGGQA